MGLLKKLIEMITQKYYHSKYDPSSSEIIPYAGREVLVRHFPGSKEKGKETGPMAVIAGFIEGEYMKPQEGSVPITTIRIITDPTQRKELTDLLTQRGETKPINFWNS